jgi:hypothetical protein
LSTASGNIVRKRRTGARRPIRPITWVVLGIIVILAFGALALTILGWWPVNGGVSQPPAGSVTPTSANAAFVKVEKVGTPVRQGDQVTVQVKITNNHLMQAPQVQGTPTPGAATPAPEPAKIINATVKVIFFDKDPSDPKWQDRQIVGSAVGNYYNPQGLADGQSATIDVVATGVGDFKDYQVSPDTVFTDKDPVKVPTPSQ